MVGSDAGSYATSVLVVLSSFRCARFSSFILRFSMRFISFCRFWNVVAISLSLTAECGGGQAPAVQPIQVEGKLPARFAWLPRRLTIIFVRKAVAPSALAASPAATARA